MTREEAIEYAEKKNLKLEEEIERPGRYYGAYAMYSTELEFVSMAISALRQQGQERNAPLTLDELREIDGEPVWIVEYPDWGHWELSADAEDYVADREPSFYGMKHNDPAGRYGLHKLGWLAYRQKPEEVQK